MMAHYLPHKSESWHHVRAATTKLDQKASPTKTRGFLIQICENPDIISQNRPHQNLLRTSIYKTQKDHQQRRHNAQPRAAINLRRPAAQSFKPVQICFEFQKTDHTRVSHGLRRTKPENFRPRNPDTRRHAPLEARDIAASTNTRSHAPPSSFTRSHAPAGFHALTRAMTSWMTSSSTNRFDLVQPTRFDPDPPNLTRIRTA